MKTWEKVYWGIAGGFVLLMALGITIHKGDIKTTIAGHTLMSKWKALGIALIVWLGLFTLIWLIVKALTGGFSSSSR